MRRYLRLLRRRDYALLWSGATVSALGDGMSFVALVWLVLERTGDPRMVGWLAAAYTGPVVIGGLVAGIVLDRFDRRAVLAADNAIRGLAIASIPIADALGALTTGHLFVVAAIYGLLFMVSLAGIPSILPTLVDPDDLTTANAMESVSYGIAGLAGPALAGVVIAAVGASTVLAVDAVTYAVFVGCLLAMRPGSTSEKASEARTTSSGIMPAIRFLLATPALVAITLMYMTMNVGEGMFIVLAPVYARDVLEGGSGTYGLLVSSFTAGGLVGSVLVGAIGWRRPLGRSIAAATLATGLTLGLLALTPPLPLAVACLLAAGLLASSLTAWAQTIRMRLIPPELRGRVFALLRTLMQATPPIGAVLAGAMLAGGDPVPVAVAIAAIIAVPGALGLVSGALGPEATAEPRATSGLGDEREPGLAG